MNAWVAVFSALVSARYAWVAVVCAIVSARYAYVGWYKRRRWALVESIRNTAIAELERAGAPRDEALMTALVNRDLDAVTQALSSQPRPDTLAVAQARRYAEADQAAITFFNTHFFLTSSSLTLVLLLQAEDAHLRVIETVQMVSHIDSAFGHTIVFVLYRPDSATEVDVRSLGAICVVATPRRPVSSAATKA